MDIQNANDQVPKPDARKILWFVFISAIIVYNIIAMLLAQAQEDFKGFVASDDGFASLLFYVLLSVSLINFIVLFKLKEKIAKESLPRKKQSLTVASYAIGEMMAIFGLVLFLVAGNFAYLYSFSVLALVGMILVYPGE
jgi:hypothetical protein